VSSPADSIQEVAVNPIRIDVTDAAEFSDDGLIVTQPWHLLQRLGYTDVPAMLGHLPAIHQGGVQTARTGVIQDPAGSAIGTGSRPGGGGASGAIYATFPDLKPIDAIEPRSAIFNRSTGPGRRVLHTHSPMLPDNPRSADQRNRALADLANAYYNALVAVSRRSDALGPDGTLLNLVPVAAAIYGGGFVHPRFNPPHLDPSYTLTAILIAIGELLRNHASIVPLALYYFRSETYRAAADQAATLRSAGY
jgi:hypothetical protein